jgi:hypothetical protein
MNERLGKGEGGGPRGEMATRKWYTTMSDFQPNPTDKCQDINSSPQVYPHPTHGARLYVTFWTVHPMDEYSLS